MSIKKNNKIVLIILIITLFLIILVIYGFCIHNKYKNANNTSNENIIYKVVYYEDYIPGSKSEINIFDNNTLEIITTYFCSAVDCQETEPKKQTFKYSKENMDKLKQFIKSNFFKSDNQIIEIKENELNEQQNDVMLGILLGEYFFETSVEEYKYKLEYSKNDELIYIAYFKDDKSILVKKLNINNDYDIVDINTYSLNFSQENLNILYDYIEEEVKNENSNIISKYSTLKKNEINIINCIVENNESYLKNIHNEPKLMYTITYDGINCQTPYLYLYSDNTYEYYDTCSINNEQLIPKTGTYNYDILKIINNINKYEENTIGSYYIKDSNGNNYVTYNTNIELQELLESLNITLEKCLKKQ